MKKLLLLLLCVPLIGLGQSTLEWEYAYAEPYNEYAFDIQQTLDGGYIVVGNYLLKLDSNGNTWWTDTIYGVSIEETVDGGYIICGGDDPFRSYDIIKIDSSGVFDWKRSFWPYSSNDLALYKTQQTNDGGYITAGGYLAGQWNGGKRLSILIKSDVNGDTLWTKTYGDPLWGEEFRDVKQTTDNGYIACGTIQTDSINQTPPVQSLLVRKVDSSGFEEWNKIENGGATFLSGFYAGGYSVEQTIDGGYVICGRIRCSHNTSNWTDILVLKIDSYGNTIWSRLFDGKGTHQTGDIGKCIKQTSDGGYIICGTAGISFSQWKDFYVLKIDSLGMKEWSQEFHFGSAISGGFSVEQTTDGGYILCGYTRISGTYDMYVIKLSADGSATSTFNIPMPSNKELEKVVDILGREVNPEKNKPFIEIYNDGTVEKKIIIE